MQNVGIVNDHVHGCFRDGVEACFRGFAEAGDLMLGARRRSGPRCARHASACPRKGRRYRRIRCGPGTNADTASGADTLAGGFDQGFVDRNGGRSDGLEVQVGKIAAGGKGLTQAPLDETPVSPNFWKKWSSCSGKFMGGPANRYSPYCHSSLRAKAGKPATAEGSPAVVRLMVANQLTIW